MCSFRGSYGNRGNGMKLRPSDVPLNAVADTMKLFLPREYSKSIQISREYSNRKKSAEIKGFPNSLGCCDFGGLLRSLVTRARRI